MSSKSKPSLKTTNHKPTKAQQEAIDEAIRKAIGKGVAVEACIGRRYTNGPQGQPFMRFVLSDLRTVFVSSWHKDEINVTVSDKKLDPKSYSGRLYYAKQKRAEERIAKAKAAEAKQVIADTFRAKVVGNPTLPDKENAKLVKAAKAKAVAK